MVDPKDFLPALGIVIGWALAEGSAFGKRNIERRRILGRAISLLYFQFHEMVQVKRAQEFAKNQATDVTEWERTRQRAFAQYTLNSEDHLSSLTQTVEELGSYYPIEAYRLRQLLWQYEFIKSRKLDPFTTQPKAYLAILSTYEMSYLIYQYQLELLLRFLAFRQSKWLWARFRYQLWHMRRLAPKGDLVFLQQMKGFRSKFRSARKENSEPNSMNDIVTAILSAAKENSADETSSYKAADADNAGRPN